MECGTCRSRASRILLRSNIIGLALCVAQMTMSSWVSCMPSWVARSCRHLDFSNIIQGECFVCSFSFWWLLLTHCHVQEWWDGSDDAGPAQRPRSEVTTPRPTLKILSFSSNRLSNLSLEFRRFWVWFKKDAYIKSFLKQFEFRIGCFAVPLEGSLLWRWRSMVTLPAHQCWTKSWSLSRHGTLRILQGVRWAVQLRELLLPNMQSALDVDLFLKELMPPLIHTRPTTSWTVASFLKPSWKLIMSFLKCSFRNIFYLLLTLFSRKPDELSQYFHSSLIFKQGGWQQDFAKAKMRSNVWFAKTVRCFYWIHQMHQSVWGHASWWDSMLATSKKFLQELC